MDLMRKDATPSRPIPFTGERAFTELVRCRRHLDTAVESLELAVEIFSRLNSETDGPPVFLLEEVLGRMEEAEATLRSAASAMTEPAPASRTR